MRKGSSNFKLGQKLRGGLLSFHSSKGWLYHRTNNCFSYRHEKVGYINWTGVCVFISQKRFWTCKWTFCSARVLTVVKTVRKEKLNWDHNWSQICRKRELRRTNLCSRILEWTFLVHKWNKAESRVKQYSCLFTWSTFRAIHIEAAHS